MRAQTVFFAGLLSVCLLLIRTEASGQPSQTPPEGGADPDREPAACVGQWTLDDTGDQVPAESPQPGIGTIAWKDAAILIAPVHWSGKDWLLFSGAVAGIVVLGAFGDEPIRTFTQDHRTPALDSFTKAVAPFGEEYGWAVIGVYGIAGFVFKDPAAREIAVDGAIATILASGLIAPALKVVIGRSRPETEEGAHSFHPFSTHFDHTSLPAGHATEAFAIASVISAHSDKLWVNVSAYTLASLVAFSRVYQDAHWTSDVLAGALIGTAVGHSVVALNRKLRHGDRDIQVGFAPIMTSGRRGASLLLTF